MTLPGSAQLMHLVLATAILVGYVVLTALGHDANALLGVLIGQAGGGIIQATSEKASGSA